MERLLVLAVEFQNEEEKEILIGIYNQIFVRRDVRNRIFLCENKGAILIIVPNNLNDVVLSNLEELLCHVKLFLIKEYENDNLDEWWNLCIRLCLREVNPSKPEKNAKQNESVAESCTKEIQTEQLQEEEIPTKEVQEEEVQTEQESSITGDFERESEKLDYSGDVISAETFLKKAIHPGMTADDTVNKVVEELSLTQLFIPLFKKAIKVDKVTWEHLGLTAPYKRKKFINEFSMRIQEKGIKPIRLPYFMAKLKEVYENEVQVESMKNDDTLHEENVVKEDTHEESSRKDELQEKGKLDSVIEIIKAKGKEITVENLLNEIGLEKLSMEKQDAIKKLVKEFMNSTNDANTFVENMDLEERLILASMLDATFPEKIQVQEFLKILKKFG